MPGYRRWHGEMVFLTLVTAGRRKLFLSEQPRRLLRQAMERTRHQRPWTTVGLVLLPDHIHMLWRMPTDDLDYSVRISALKNCFTRAFLWSGGQEAPVPAGQCRHGLRGVWQRRFWEHTIRDARDFRMHLDYIHLNPVKHGLAERVRDWPWSTFHQYVLRGWYEPDWQGCVELAGSTEYLWMD